MSPRGVLTACLAAVIGLGTALLLMGLLIEPLLPLHQVDVVLTPQQLADDRVRRETQEMLAKARGNIPFAWLAAGLIAVVSGATGLIALRKIPGPPPR